MAEPKSIEERLRQYKQRAVALQSDRSSWDSHWKDLGAFFMPRGSRFNTESETNKGGKDDWTNIIDNTGLRAKRVLAAGMMAGMTSPARPWFRLATTDPALMEVKAVKLWLNQCTTTMRDVFARSNTYRALHKVYEELGVYGTSVVLVNDDFEDVINMVSVPIGEYAIALDNKGRARTLHREFVLTVEQLVSEFGLDAVSQTVRRLWDNGNRNQKVKVCHLIEPNYNMKTGSMLNTDMAYSSVYYESGGDGNKLLRDSGTQRFKALIPRWDTIGNDAYGISPGMEALGDNASLQHQQTRKAEGIDYSVKPPLQVPSSLKGHEVDMLPGGVTWYDSPGAQAGIRSMWEVRLDMNHLLADIQDVRARVNQAFYVDLFMMLANDQRSNITAREVAERHEEKLIVLGPVLERLHNELLDPLIDITFARMLEARGADGTPMLPEPPPELQGVKLNVEFVSTLAQAQRAVGVGAIDRLIGTVTAIASGKQDPSVWDKIETDQVIDQYSEMLGADPSVIRSDDEVAAMRESRAQAQQAQQMAAMAQPMAQAAGAAKTLSETDTEGKNALTDITRMFQGYS